MIAESRGPAFRSLQESNAIAWSNIEEAVKGLETDHLFLQRVKDTAIPLDESDQIKARATHFHADMEVVLGPPPPRHAVFYSANSGPSTEVLVSAVF